MDDFFDRRNTKFFAEKPTKFGLVPVGSYSTLREAVDALRGIEGGKIGERAIEGQISVAGYDANGNETGRIVSTELLADWKAKRITSEEFIAATGQGSSQQVSSPYRI